MSDAGRQDISDKIHDKLKPNSEKSTPEHFGDKIKGSLDNFVGHATPSHDKSKTQQVSDKIFGDNKK